MINKPMVSNWITRLTNEQQYRLNCCIDKGSLSSEDLNILESLSDKTDSTSIQRIDQIIVKGYIK